MRIRRFALAGAVLTLVLMPRVGKSQGAQPDKKKPVVTLGQSYPNPTNPDAHITFQVGGYPACTDNGKQYRVNLKVFNVLAQVVAVPKLTASSTGVAGGRRLENTMLPCGDYTAYWDGKYAGTLREAASGVYLWAIEVDGVRAVVRSTIAK